MAGLTPPPQTPQASHIPTLVELGLENVNNTSDMGKPISTADQIALNAKANSLGIDDNYATGAEKTKLGNLSGINTGDQNLSNLVVNTRTVNGHALTSNVTVSKGDVGLGSVDNTADTAKPVSTAQQTALDLKANLASPTFTGTVAGVTKAMVGLGSVDNTADASKPVSTTQQTALDLKANLASPTFTGTVAGITKTMVGLSNVDNTSDAGKPVSTAQQTALDLKLTKNVAITGATVGDATHIPVITYDLNGLITGTSTATISSGTQRTFAYFAG